MKEVIMHGTAEEIRKEVSRVVNSFTIPYEEIAGEFVEDDAAAFRFMQLAAKWIEACDAMYAAGTYDDRNRYACIVCETLSRSRFVRFYANDVHNDFSETADICVCRSYLGGMHRTLQQSWTGLCFRILEAIRDKDTLLDNMITKYTSDPRWYMLPLI